MISSAAPGRFSAGRMFVYEMHDEAAASDRSDLLLISFICATKTHLRGSDMPAVCTIRMIVAEFHIS